MDDTDPTAAPSRRGPAAPTGRPLSRAGAGAGPVATAPLPPPPPPPPSTGTDPARPDPDGELARIVRRAGAAADAAASASGTVSSMAPAAGAPASGATGRRAATSDDRDAVAPTSGPPQARAGVEESSILDGRVLAICAAVLVVVALVCSQLLTIMGASKPVVTIADGFTGDAPGGLGETDSGQVWDVPTGGAFGEENGAAFVAEPNPRGPRTVAVVDLESSHGFVQADVAHLAEGWGLVFRYQGPSNYWMVTASPQFASLNLSRVEDGRHVPIENGLARLERGSTVTVRFQGPVIEMVVDERIVKRVSVPTTGSLGTKVGLLATQASPDSRWSAFAAEQLPAAGAAPAPPTTLRGGR